MPTQTSFSQTFTPPFFDNVTNFSGNPDPFVSAFIETVPTPAPFFDSLPSSSAHPPSFPAGPAPSSAVVTSIVATLPSAMQGFALGNGSDTKDDNASDVSSFSAPISVPHLVWRANASSIDDFLLSLDCLLDSGSHLILIRPETVADLRLPI